MTERFDNERFPLLTTAGKAMLKRLSEHPYAPLYRNNSGPRLTRADIDLVSAFECEVEASGAHELHGELPHWLPTFLDHCIDQVPYYRRYGMLPRDFSDIPTTDRGDLSRDIATFVPDTLDLERLIHFSTSGTTGHPLLLPSHPRVAANYLAFHKKALRRFGIELTHGAGQVGVVLLGYQQRCFTYVSVTPTMGESGLVKLNLHPNDWRDPEDRARYLDDLNAEVLSGDPLSFTALLDLPLKTRPRALLSTSMALLPGFRKRLEEAFSCPVLDLYSMNEAGPIAVYDPQVGGHVLLQHRLYVEILDRSGKPVAEGERGEITLTGGFNFCLPLLRYRTGDYARYRLIAEEPVLFELEGRPPVMFRTRDGTWINNVDVTHVLGPFALSRFSLHQGRDGELALKLVDSYVVVDDIRAVLLKLFGEDQALTIETGMTFPDKVIQYTSDLSGCEVQR
jgi:phenylacetate-CoA ligase